MLLHCLLAALLCAISSPAHGSLPNHYGHDGHGSVRLLSDGAGQVTDALHYETFGRIVSRVGGTPAF